MNFQVGDLVEVQHGHGPDSGLSGVITHFDTYTPVIAWIQPYFGDAFTCHYSNLILVYPKQNPETERISEWHREVEHELLDFELCISLSLQGEEIAVRGYVVNLHQVKEEIQMLMLATSSSAHPPITDAQENRIRVISYVVDRLIGEQK